MKFWQSTIIHIYDAYNSYNDIPKEAVISWVNSGLHVCVMQHYYEHALTFYLKHMARVRN